MRIAVVKELFVIYKEVNLLCKIKVVSMWIMWSCCHI